MSECSAALACIRLSGLADEAATDIGGQISSHCQLGWQSIELRLVDGKNVCSELSDREFETVAERVRESGLDVSAFSSAIGNWSRTIDGDCSVDLSELKIAIPRMQSLGAKYIRTMSWLAGDVDDPQWRKETLRRYRELALIAQDNGVVLAHENCTGWAGQGPEQTRILMEEIDSPALVALFDIGNTISHGYDPLAFYRGVRPFIGYVHVKDCRRNPQGGRSSDYTYPGCGDAQVETILRDLLKTGYQGYVSIEPHIASIVHLGGPQSSAEDMGRSYIRYAREAEALLNRL